MQIITGMAWLGQTDLSAYNTNMKHKRISYETHERSVAKSLIFRVVVVISDTTVIYLLTRRVSQTISLTIITNIASMTLYYLYERIWNQIKWGRV